MDQQPSPNSSPSNLVAMSLVAEDSTSTTIESDVTRTLCDSARGRQYRGKNSEQAQMLPVARQKLASVFPRTHPVSVQVRRDQPDVRRDVSLR